MSSVSLEPKIEEKLVKESKRNKQAFAKLYGHYHVHIERFFKSRLSDTALAEDLTSKVFEKALLSIDNFQWQGVSFSAWLYKIAKNTLIDYFRKNSSTKNVVALNADLVESTYLSPYQVVESYFEDEILHEVLNELPEKERTIVYLKFFDGCKNKTIAHITGLTETNVGTILHRTTKKLRAKLQAKNYKN